MIRTSITLCLIAVTLGCRTTTNNETNPATGMRDTIAASNVTGVNYVELTANALNRDEHSLHRLFIITGNFDGAAAEGHSSVLREILTRTGDDYFGMQLARETPQVRNMIHEQLLHDFGWGNTEIRISDLKKWYPKTFKGCQRSE